MITQSGVVNVDGGLGVGVGLLAHLLLDEGADVSDGVLGARYETYSLISPRIEVIGFGQLDLGPHLLLHFGYRLPTLAYDGARRGAGDEDLEVAGAGVRPLRGRGTDSGAWGLHLLDSVTVTQILTIVRPLLGDALSHSNQLSCISPELASGEERNVIMALKENIFHNFACHLCKGVVG